MISNSNQKSFTMKSVIQPGIYSHFKGEEYEVLGTAKHSETEEEHVVYRPLKNTEQLWIRPLTMFTETIEREGKKLQRFSLKSALPEKTWHAGQALMEQ